MKQDSKFITVELLSFIYKKNSWNFLYHYICKIATEKTYI